MKDPDALFDCAKQEAAEQVESMDRLDADEKEALIESRTEKLSSFARNWLKYGECAVIEFDTEANTATLIRTT
jgi:hypothetical protein